MKNSADCEFTRNTVVVIENQATNQHYESEPYLTGRALDVRCQCGGLIHPMVGAWCRKCGAKVVQVRQVGSYSPTCVSIDKSEARLRYEHRTTTVIESLKDRPISFQECIQELDAAFEKFVVPNKDELSAVRALVLENNNIVMQEMAMRCARSA
jgi:hypothetical protein